MASYNQLNSVSVQAPWICSNCTLENDYNLLNCKVCNARNPNNPNNAPARPLIN